MCCLSTKRILKRKSDVSSEKLEECKVEKNVSTVLPHQFLISDNIAYFVENGATYKKTVITQGAGQRLSCVEP